MKRIIFVLAILQSILGQSQGIVEWPKDSIVSAKGDTSYLNPFVFHPISQTDYYDSEKKLISSTVLIGLDTVKFTMYYRSGAVKEEYYEKLAQPIDTITDFNPEWPGNKLVKHVKYCENGNIRENHSVTDTSYEVYDCQGNLWMSADSINEYFMPLDIFMLHDTITGELREKGLMKTCSYNRTISCQDGWWDFYKNRVLVSRELFEDGRSTKKINYR